MRAEGVPRMSDDVFVHESAYVDDGALIGHGTKIWHFCHVMPRRRDRRAVQPRPERRRDERHAHGQRIARFKTTCRSTRASSSRTTCSVGRRWCSRTSSIRAATCRARTSTSARWSSAARRSARTRRSSAASTLGEYAFVGAGAVVTKDVLPYALMAGVPARRIGWMCQCGERLPDTGVGTCAACGTTYARSGDGIAPSANENERRRR